MVAIAIADFVLAGLFLIAALSRVSAAKKSFELSPFLSNVDMVEISLAADWDMFVWVPVGAGLCSE